MANVTSVRIEEPLSKRLAELANSISRSKAWVINQALREYIERDTLKKQRWRETETALAAIESGDIYEAAAVHDWMDSWFSEAEKPVPHRS